MSTELAPADRAAIENIVGQLEAAGNAMDGPAIAAGHTAIFQTIYAGSTNRYTVETARLVHPEVALLHVHAALDAPQSPLAGRHLARFSIVATKTASGRWEIASFHNTLEAPAAPPR